MANLPGASLSFDSAKERRHKQDDSLESSLALSIGRLGLQPPAPELTIFKSKLVLSLTGRAKD